MQVYLYVKPLQYTVIQYSGVDKYFNCISDIANVYLFFRNILTLKHGHQLSQILTQLRNCGHFLIGFPILLYKQAIYHLKISPGILQLKNSP